MKKKDYLVPQVKMLITTMEYGVLGDLTSNGDGTWTQGPVGDDDPEDPTEDDGRSKGFRSVWED